MMHVAANVDDYADGAIGAASRWVRAADDVTTFHSVAAEKVRVAAATVQIVAAATVQIVVVAQARSPLGRLSSSRRH